MKPILFCVLLFLCLSFIGNSQEIEEEKPLIPQRQLKPIGFMAGVGGPGSFSNVSIDAFVTKFLNIEAGIGSGLFGLTHDGPIRFANITYHTPFSSKNINSSFFWGIGYSNYTLILQFTEGGRLEKVNGIYLASGIKYIANSGFTLKFELGPMYKFAVEHYGMGTSYSKTTNTSGVTAYVSVKIGLHFGSSNNKKKGASKKPKGNIEIERNKLEQRNKLY